MTSVMNRYAFAFEPRYRIAAAPFGITPGRAWLEFDDSRIAVRFGPWHVETPRENVTAAAVTGPYAFVKTAGPARLSIGDRGLTFATNSHCGVQLDFAEPVRGIDPTGLIRHPNLTVTPGDCRGIAIALDPRISRLEQEPS